VKQKCRHGINCKNLKKGICRFSHPPKQNKTLSATKGKNPPTRNCYKATPVISPTAAPAPTATIETKPADELLLFLKNQKPCLKVSPDKFFKWLMGEDIVSLSDLLDALTDDEYKTQLIINGLKKFKSPVFHRGLEIAIEQSKPENSKTSEPVEIPDELLCPITYNIFVDPVVAKDGCTYERSSIEEWFHKQQSQVNAAQVELVCTPHSERAKAVIERGVMAPSGMSLNDLALVPNNNTRIMARQFLASAGTSATQHSDTRKISSKAP
jgi:hypothetical protein